MTTHLDWIRVTLTPQDMQLAEHIGTQRQHNSRHSTAHANHDRYLDTNILGAQGEIAVAKYCGTPINPNRTYREEKAAGYDVAGWQVRTRPRAHYGLGLHRGDHGRFILVLAHEAPTMYLAGWLEPQWIETEQRYEHSTRRYENHYRDDDPAWWLIEQHHLHPLPEQHGYTRGSIGHWHQALLDANPLFWCENCNGRHPIREMQTCQ